MPDRRPKRIKATPRRNSLTAAATVLTSASRPVIDPAERWQTAAWDYYDTVGELRFAIGWIGNAMSRVNLVAAAPPDDPGDDPTSIDPNAQDVVWTAGQRRAVELVSMIAGGVSGQGALLQSFGQLLTLVGQGFLVAEPLTGEDAFSHWHVVSAEEIRTVRDGFELRTGANSWRPVHPDSLVASVWRQHPRWSWQPDSPVRALLGVLQQIRLLHAHIDSSASSRLIGAGMVLVPQELDFPQGSPGQARVPISDDESGDEEQDLTETIMRVAEAAKANPESPAAQVPIFVAMPGEYVDKVKHLRFDTPFDERAQGLLDNAIRRLALGLDMPPEVLLGVGGMNHWGAWQVEETAIQLHVVPTAEMVCHGLTEAWLRPALEAEGYDPDEALVWFDTEELTHRPDLSTRALEAYDRGELSGRALLRESGLSLDDQTSDEERKQKALLDVATRLPSAAPGILALLGLIDETDIPKLRGSVIPATVTETTPAPIEERPQPDTRDEALVAACDALVWRALDRAGSRMMQHARKQSQALVDKLQTVTAADRHTVIEVESFTNLPFLLDGAWTRVPAIAARHNVDPGWLESRLDMLARAALSAGVTVSVEAVRRALDA